MMAEAVIEERKLSRADLLTDDEVTLVADEIVARLGTAGADGGRDFKAEVGEAVRAVGVKRARKLVGWVGRVVMDGGWREDPDDDASRKLAPVEIFLRQVANIKGSADAGRSRSLDLAGREEAVREASAAAGAALQVLLLLQGRPGRAVRRGDTVVISMKVSGHPTIPHGVPRPPVNKAELTLYLSERMWRPVEAALVADPNAEVFVEGYPVADQRTGAIAVFVTNVEFVPGEHTARAERVAARGQKARPAAARPARAGRGDEGGYGRGGGREGRQTWRVEGRGAARGEASAAAAPDPVPPLRGRISRSGPPITKLHS